MEENNENGECSECEEVMVDYNEDSNQQSSSSEGGSSSEEDTYHFGDSDDTDSDRDADSGNDAEMESDIDGENGGYTDERAWGRRKKRFYNTDFVDEDCKGFYTDFEAEDAAQEEEEARLIQERLAAELNETDFVIALRASETQTTENEKFEEVARDISSLTTREKLDLMQKESPEFFVLVQDLKNKLHEIDNILIPILSHFGNSPDMPAPVKFLKKKFLVLTNYCTNITFYLLLKAKKSPVENHPVLKSLYKYRRVMDEIQEIDEAMRPKIEKVLSEIKVFQNPVLEKLAKTLQKKSLLDVIQRCKENSLKKFLEANYPQSPAAEGLNNFGESAQYAIESAQTFIHCTAGCTTKCPGFRRLERLANIRIIGLDKEKKGKRGITRKIAKNKGLMPRRNKLQRNPRVKHRNKYRKALIRRRGQVRYARTDIPVYGGEPSGIKATVTKSTKFK